MDKEEKPAGCCDSCEGCSERRALAAAVDEMLAREMAPLPALEEAPPAETVDVVDVRFRNGGKIYYFDPDGLALQSGDAVILDTARGAEYAVCAGGIHKVCAEDIVAPLRKVLRKATEQDQAIAAANREKEKRAFEICQKKIADHHLEMQLISAELAFDGSKILFFFTADGRVDFRELVKNLASTFRTRIELRQIGVRDKAKMVGGLGVCGRPFCCSMFLEEFQPVSIKMAKTQNLSLNPGKISGTCGRLMCCLKYEQEAYEDLLQHSPKLESLVDTPGGRGTVCEVNLLRQSVQVRMEDQPETIERYSNDEIAILRNGKARKGDPPVPREIAPISGRTGGRRKSLVKPVAQQEEDSISSIFQRMDDYAAQAGETPEPERRRPRRKRRNPHPEADDFRMESSRMESPRPEASRPDGKPHANRRRSRRPRRSNDGQQG